MKPQVFVLLVTRILGLCLLLWRLPEVLGGLGQLFHQVGARSVGYVLAQSSAYYLDFLGVLAQFVLGAYMLIGGRRLIRLLLRGLPGVPGVCERCGYDVAGLEGGRCPECGAKVPERQ